MKSLVDLLVDLLLDCGRKSGAPCSRDVKTLRARVKHEGDSFITITLPSFCRDFERSLDSGLVAPGSFLSFGKKGSGIPEFLQGFLRHVFDPEGTLLASPSIDCIRSIRQICLFGKKIQRPCSPERELNAIEEYVKCDNSIVATEPTQLDRYFDKVASIILPALLEDDGFATHIVPTHGPGATYERISGNQKWVFRKWYRRLEDVGYTYLLYGRGCSTVHDCEEFSMPDVVDPSDEFPVRVTLVPKTLKTPRIIAVEPVCMQYAQQGLMRFLVRQLESCRFTAGHVNFRDQTVNQGLALSSSQDRLLATLDMSEASDRVSLAHASRLFASTPKFWSWVLACRSSRSKLPDGRLIDLRKFASMGSALCFPVESMVFFVSIIASRIRRAGYFPDARHVYSFARDVYVYGDDLIVPADEASAVCDDLETLGFKVNRHKSFWTGKFRESCGSDCYDNEEVTPVYLRRDLPTSRRDVSGLISTIATCNQLYLLGYKSAAATLRKVVEAILGPLPQVPRDSPALGWFDVGEHRPRKRWNRNLQRFEYLCWLPRTPKDADSIDGDAALAKCFRLIGQQCQVDPEHLERSPRHHGLALKRGWAPLSCLDQADF